MKQLAFVLLYMYVHVNEVHRCMSTHQIFPLSHVGDLQTFPKYKNSEQAALSRRTNRPAVISLR
jgi:hypothetical protein